VNAALILAGYVYLVWLLFLVVMALMHARDRGVLPRGTLLLAAPAIALAVVLDVGLNGLATIAFWELPQELTFSQRMGRYKQWAALRPNHWRVRAAVWICANLLDCFQIGGHCR